MRDYEAEEAIKREMRRRRRAEIRRRKRRRAKIKRALTLACVGVCLLLFLALGVFLVKGISGFIKENKRDKELAAKQEEELERALQALPEEETAQPVSEEIQTTEDASSEEKRELPFAAGYRAEATERTVAVDSQAVTSNYALLIDLDSSEIVAERNAKVRINPASMTKILTLLVAAEHVTNLDDTFTITREITDYSYSNGCSAAGFDDGETVTLRDLMYGTILPSGGDAAAGLAFYVSGSLEAFAKLLNEKIEELGLSSTSHFTNCVGLYDENHYCTVYDMAMMLKAAEENELCREILGARVYTTSPTEQHPEGIELSNWFIRRIEDKETGGKIEGAKTGYVLQSGNCGASYFVSDSGRHYICVTADAHSSWRCIYDHVAMYQKYAK